MQEIAAQMLAGAADVEVEVVRSLLERQAGYATPKIDVRCAAFRDGKILLVRERSDGCWTLPGGWADVTDSPAEAAERELWEESGFHGKATKALAIWDRKQHNHPPHAFAIYKIVFRLELIGGEAASSMETDGVGFFAENELPPLSTGRVTVKQIHRIYEHYRNSELPTDFD